MLGRVSTLGYPGINFGQNWSNFTTEGVVGATHAQHIAWVVLYAPPASHPHETGGGREASDSWPGEGYLAA